MIRITTACAADHRFALSAGIQGLRDVRDDYQFDERFAKEWFGARRSVDAGVLARKNPRLYHVRKGLESVTRGPESPEDHVHSF